MRELKSLKITADYSAYDPTGLDKWLMGLSPELSQYTYFMLRQGVDKFLLRSLSEQELKEECAITNSIHRRKIMQHVGGTHNCYGGGGGYLLKMSLSLCQICNRLYTTFAAEHQSMATYCLLL
jgi:hypothetical protein